MRQVGIIELKAQETVRTQTELKTKDTCIRKRPSMGTTGEAPAWEPHTPVAQNGEAKP